VVVAKPLHNATFDRLVAIGRARLGVETIAPRGALRAAAEALARGTSVVMPIDQAPEASALEAGFLGARCAVDRAPFVLAARAGVRVVVAAQRRIGRAQELSVLGVLEPPRRAGIDRAATEATALLEAFVREHPESWLWLHRRWKALPARARAGN
jgi:KDO2-lipid IV(A) lauroyltransferase